MPEQPAPRMTLPVAAAFYLAVVVLAVAWAGFTRPGLHLLIGAPRDLPLPWWLAGVLVGLGLIAVTAIAEARSESLRRVGAELAEIVAPATWTRAIVLAVLSGVSEEALFRGPMQYALVSQWGPTPGFVATALAFALLHGGVKPRYLPWSTFALLAGLLFGLLASVYGSPWPAAAAHIVVNAVNLRRLSRYVQDEAGR